MMLVLQADPLGPEVRRRGPGAPPCLNGERRGVVKQPFRASAGIQCRGRAAPAKRHDGPIEPGAGVTLAAAFPGFPWVVRKHIPRETTGPCAAPRLGGGGRGWFTLGPPRSSLGRLPGQPPPLLWQMD